MLIGMGVASTNRTDKFWHTGSAEEYSSEEFDDWGVRSYARVWRSYLQAILSDCYFWFRQCGDVIIYVIPHYLYSDIIVVWMWYSTGIWVIWSTMVLLHFDSVDFPSWKSGCFREQRRRWSSSSRQPRWVRHRGEKERGEWVRERSEGTILSIQAQEGARWQVRAA